MYSKFEMEGGDQPLFSEQKVITAADSNVFLWSERTSEERFKLLMVERPGEQIQLQTYNDIYDANFKEKFSGLDMVWQNGDLMPFVSEKGGVSYSPLIIRDVNKVTVQQEPKLIPIYGSRKAVVYVNQIAVMKNRVNNQAWLRCSVYPTGWKKRAYNSESEWSYVLPYSGSSELHLYGLYLSHLRQEGLFGPLEGYYDSGRSQLSEINRRYSLPFIEHRVGMERFPLSMKNESATFKGIGNLIKQSKAKKEYALLQDRTQNSLYYWASEIVLGTRLEDMEKIRESPAFDRISEIVNRANESIMIYKKTACKHFSRRSRFDAAYKSTTKYAMFTELLGLARAEHDQNWQYHCEYCDLELYCEHELQQVYHKAEILDKFGKFSGKDDNITCKYCSRVIGVAQPDTVQEYDSSNRLITGKAVVTKMEKAFKEFLGLVLGFLGKGFPKMAISEVYDELRTVIDAVYQKAQTNKKMTQVGVNMLIVAAWISYLVMEGRVSMKLFGQGRAVPEINVVISSVVSKFSSNLYFHGIIEQLPSVENWTKKILESYVYPQLKSAKTDAQPKVKENIFTTDVVVIVNYDTLYSKYLQDLPFDRRPMGKFIRQPRTRTGTKMKRVVTDLTDPFYTFVSVDADDGHTHMYDKSRCEVCKKTFGDMLKKTLAQTEKDHTELFKLSENKRLVDLARKFCPLRKVKGHRAHLVVYDVCVNCKLNLVEIAAYKPTEEEINLVRSEPKSEELKLRSPSKVRKICYTQKELDDALTDFIKILAKVAPKEIDGIKSTVKQLQGASELDILSEYVIKFAASKRIEPWGCREAVSCLTAMFLDANKNSTVDPCKLVKFLKAHSDLHRAKSYDPVEFVYEEIRILNEIHMKFLEEFSKTMEQKIAEAIMNNEVEEYVLEVEQDPDELGDEEELSGNLADAEPEES